MVKNKNRAYVVLLEDSFDVASNYFLVDSYLSLLAVTSQTNDKIFKFLKADDPIWKESHLEPFQSTIKNFRE